MSARGARYYVAGVEDMRNRQNEFVAALKWPALAAVLVAGAFALLPALRSAPTTAPSEPPVEIASRDAMRILRDGHDRVLDQVDRQRAESEQKAAEEAHAFEQAREQARIAAAREAARKLAEQRAAEQRQAEQRQAEQRQAEQRAAEAKRVADVTPAKLPKPKPEPVAAGAPLEIVPAPGEPPVQKPRGPIETVVATVGGVADDIKNKTVSTVVGIKDWFSAAGDKLLGRDKPPSAVPASRLSSTL
jgi:Skp family chaperone for outer membrane proteins